MTNTAYSSMFNGSGLSSGTQLPAFNASQYFPQIQTPAPTLASSTPALNLTNPTIGGDTTATMFNSLPSNSGLTPGITTPGPTQATGNGLTNFFNSGKPATILDPVTGQQIANPDLYSTGDIATGIGATAQLGLGAYSMFKNLGFQSEQLNQSQQALDLNRASFDESQRHNAAIVAQNRGS